MFSFFEKLINPFPEKEIPVPPKSFVPFVLGAVRGLGSYIVWMGILAGCVGAAEGLLFAVLGNVVDWLEDISPQTLWQQGGMTLALIALLVLGSVVLVAVQTVIRWQVIAGNLTSRIRWNFHRLMLRQSMSFFQDEFAGRITTKVMQTSQAVRDLYMIVVDILVYAVIYFSTISATLGFFDWRLLLVFLLWLLSYAMLLRGVVPKLARAAKAQADARSVMVGRITDAYTNIATVKLFAHAGTEAEYAKTAMGDFLQAVQQMLRNISFFEIANHLLSMLLILASCGVALMLWSAGEVGAGALAAVGAMALRLNGLSHWIMWESTQLFEHVGTVHDGIGTLCSPNAVQDAQSAVPLVVSRGEIVFDRVCFSYGGSQDVINDFSLTIRPGEKIGLVGRSGAGKSTLAALLLRFHDVRSGTISIDGQNIAAVTQDSLRQSIGMVMQDTSLLHRSVRDNILYGRPEATEEEMRSAVAKARADGFIDKLKDPKGREGYEAHVGERGVKLSGGQRQRIAIARVMLKDAPILLLDEATSALDSEVETAIQENLYRLMEGKTVVAIAHRLSTIAAMDRLVIVEKGRIAESGTHASLLAEGGIYARLWARQSGGFIGDDQGS